MSVFVSSGAFSKARHLDELLPLCYNCGIDHVELASGLRAGEGFPEVIAAEEGMKFLLHNYFPAPEEPFVLNLADADEENRRLSLAFAAKSLQASAVAGAPFYSVHAGFVASLRPDDLGRPDRQNFDISEEAYDQALEFFSLSVAALAKEARRLGVRLMLENNVHAVPRSDRSHLLLVTPDDISRFFEHWSDPSVGLLLDVAHLNVSATHRGFDPVEAVERVSPWIGALHLSDNDGDRDTNELCREDSWFWDPLNRNCPNGVVTVLESYRLSPDQIKEQVDLISRRLSFASYSTK